MSVKTQKLIRFIPIVNFFVTLFFFYKAYRDDPQSKIKDLTKLVLTTVLLLLIINIPVAILMNIYHGTVIETVVRWSDYYIMLFAISSVLILQ